MTPLRAIRAGAGAAALVAATSPLGGCRSKISHDECAAMLDHYVDLELRGDDAIAHLPEAQATAARDAKKTLFHADPAYQNALERCVREVTRPEYACAIATNHPDQWQACID